MRAFGRVTRWVIATALVAGLGACDGGGDHERVGPRAASVIALDLATGAEHWRRDLGDLVAVYAITVSGDTVSVEGVEPVDRCTGKQVRVDFAASSGTVLRRSAPRRFGGTVAPIRDGAEIAREDGRTYVVQSVSDRPVLRAVDGATKVVAWTYRLPDPEHQLLSARSWATASISGDRLYLAVASDGSSVKGCGEG